VKDTISPGRVTLLLLLVITALLHSTAAQTFHVQVWTAEMDPPTKLASNKKLPLGKPVYVSFENFKTNQQATWLASSGIDLLTFVPLRMKLGESNGIDLSDITRGTNRPAAKFPIPKDIGGVFLRFEAATNTTPITIKTEFAYNSKDEDSAVVSRKAYFNSPLNFSSNEVAIIRLGKATHTRMPNRKVLGIPAGKRKEFLIRDVYLAIQLTNAPMTKPAF
jgi:hypothetical protein